MSIWDVVIRTYKMMAVVVDGVQKESSVGISAYP